MNAQKAVTKCPFAITKVDEQIFKLKKSDNKNQMIKACIDANITSLQRRLLLIMIIIIIIINTLFQESNTISTELIPLTALKYLQIIQINNSEIIVQKRPGSV